MRILLTSKKVYFEQSESFIDYMLHRYNVTCNITSQQGPLLRNCTRMCQHLICYKRVSPILRNIYKLSHKIETGH